MHHFVLNSRSLYTDAKTINFDFDSNLDKKVLHLKETDQRSVKQWLYCVYTGKASSVTESVISGSGTDIGRSDRKGISNGIYNGKVNRPGVADGISSSVGRNIGSGKIHDGIELKNMLQEGDIKLNGTDYDSVGFNGDKDLVESEILNSMRQFSIHDLESPDCFNSRTFCDEDGTIVEKVDRKSVKKLSKNKKKKEVKKTTKEPKDKTRKRYSGVFFNEIIFRSVKSPIQ